MAPAGQAQGELSPYDGPLTAFVAGLHNDEVTIVVDVADDAGNVSAWNGTGASAQSFTVDTTAPSTTSFAPFPEITNDDRPNLSWASVADATAWEMTSMTSS